MSHRYFPIVFLFACPQLIPMEQFATLPQKSAPRTVPSLKELALKAYRKYLYQRVPVEKLSEKKLVKWAEAHGLKALFDLRNDTLSLRLKEILGEPNGNIIPKKIQKSGFTSTISPQIFSDNGRYQLFQDPYDTQYVVHVNENFALIRMLLIEGDMGLHSTRQPLFSFDGRWLVGKSRDFLDQLLLVRYESGQIETASTEFDSTEWDYTLLNNDTIIVRTKKEIFAAQLNDLFQNGKKSFKKIYEQTDGRRFYTGLFTKHIHAIRGCSIVCLDQKEKKFEILERSDDESFSLAKTIPLIGSGNTKKIIVHSERGIGARAVNGLQGESIELYQFFGDDAGGKSKISIDNLVNVVFSPCGNYLVAELRYGISFFDCTCLTSPKKISWENYDPYGSNIHVWTNVGLVEGANRQSIIQFHPAAPLVARYAEYWKKLVS